jgi:hypothetical protein
MAAEWLAFRAQRQSPLYFQASADLTANAACTQLTDFGTVGLHRRC